MCLLGCNKRPHQTTNNASDKSKWVWLRRWFISDQYGRKDLGFPGNGCRGRFALVVDMEAIHLDSHVLVDGTHRCCLVGGPLGLLVRSAVIAFDCLWNYVRYMHFQKAFNTKISKPYGRR